MQYAKIIIKKYKPNIKKILLSHIRFYTQNMCQLRKSKIKVKTNLVISANLCKKANLVNNN